MDSTQTWSGVRYCPRFLSDRSFRFKFLFRIDRIVLPPSGSPSRRPVDCPVLPSCRPPARPAPAATHLPVDYLPACSLPLMFIVPPRPTSRSTTLRRRRVPAAACRTCRLPPPMPFAPPACLPRCRLPVPGRPFRCRAAAACRPPRCRSFAVHEHRDIVLHGSTRLAIAPIAPPLPLPLPVPAAPLPFHEFVRSSFFVRSFARRSRVRLRARRRAALPFQVPFDHAPRAGRRLPRAQHPDSRTRSQTFPDLRIRSSSQIRSDQIVRPRRAPSAPVPARPARVQFPAFPAATTDSQLTYYRIAAQLLSFDPVAPVLAVRAVPVDC